MCVCVYVCVCVRVCVCARGCRVCLKYKDVYINVLWHGLFVVVIAWLPGPILYGYLADASCLWWDKSCTADGACSFYDVDTFRMYIHGATVVAKAIGLVGFIFMYFKMDDSQMSKEDTELEVWRQTDSFR